MKKNSIPIILYALSFLLPVGYTDDSEYVLGFELFVQGFMVLILFLGNLGSPGIHLTGLFVCWASNFIFLVGYVRYLKRVKSHNVAIELAATLGMGIFMFYRETLVNGRGDDLVPISLSLGYFVWLSAPISVIALCVYSPRKGSQE